MTPIDTKTCSNPKCKQTNPQPVTEFYLSGMGGYRPKCRHCELEARRKRKAKPTRGKELFYSSEVIAMSKVCNSVKVSYFGIFIGIMFCVRSGEFFCFSANKGSYAAKSKAEGRQWLFKQFGVNWEIMKKGLLRQSRKRG